MKPTLNEKFIAYLALLSGLTLSAVAVYYSVVGLTAIFSAAVIPIIIMGTALEVSKLVATLWLKQNWDNSPRYIKAYLIIAIVILMLITSMGIFGFLSKAHNDQNLVSGEVLSKIAIYDEKIKISKDNIDAARKALKQMDEAVDQTMGRSTTEQGADRAIQVRRSQARERTRLLADIEAEQKKIAELNEAKAPIAAEVRKVEAEVGPLKYIANFIYGETDPTILEKAVVWVIITLIIVFDPLAVVLLLASQYSFQYFREREQTEPDYPPDDGPLTEEQIEQIIESAPTPVETQLNDEYLHKPGNWSAPPQEEPKEEPKEDPISKPPTPLKDLTIKREVRTKVFPRRTPPPEPQDTYVQNEEQQQSNLWTTATTGQITSDEYSKIAQARREQEIVNYAELVRTKRIQMEDIPEEYQNRVKSMV